VPPLISMEPNPRKSQRVGEWELDQQNEVIVLTWRLLSKIRCYRTSSQRSAVTMK
jgi:hypothetical protein